VNEEGVASNEIDWQPIFVLLTANYPAFTPHYIKTLTKPQIQHYLDGLPLLEYRRYFPVAQLEATVRNLGGGKPDPNAPPPETPTYFEGYQSYELLPPYAQYAPFILAAQQGNDEDYSEYISPNKARAFLYATSKGYLPNWVVQLSPISLIKKRAAEGI
jgi:hypothetical protein